MNFEGWRDRARDESIMLADITSIKQYDGHSECAG
jgi:hypothetical protein